MPNEFTYTGIPAASTAVADATDLTGEIAASAGGPAEVRGDSGSIRQHTPTQQIAADRYLAGKSALDDRTKRTFGIRMGQLIAPGAQGGE